jgi:uncharacterized protein YbaR (Trm112 family)
MFIELTDLLRCPADHAESFLVLLPEQMSGRFVRQGRLGCPVCRREFAIEGGVARLGAPDRLAGDLDPTSPIGLDPAAIHAFLGLEGPGGYVGLVGGAGRLGRALGSLLPGVHFLAVNPPPPLEALQELSVLEAPLVPVKARSLRGVVLGPGFGGDRFWQGEASRVVLPGLRVVGQGRRPERTDLELLGEAEGWWVGKTGGSGFSL